MDHLAWCIIWRVKLRRDLLLQKAKTPQARGCLFLQKRGSYSEQDQWWPGVVALIDYFESPAQSLSSPSICLFVFGSKYHKFISTVIQLTFMVKVFNKGLNQCSSCFFLLLMMVMDCMKIRNCRRCFWVWWIGRDYLDDSSFSEAWGICVRSDNLLCTEKSLFPLM